MPVRGVTAQLAAVVVLFAGCGQSQSTQSGGNPGALVPSGVTNPMSDADKVREADYSILFVGNSHISFHDLPNVVCKMIQFRHPDKRVYSHVIGVAYLEDVVRDPRCNGEIESRPWKHVVLQAQKISASGKYDYSRKEGIDIARLAKARGAKVFFFSEWGLRGVEGDGAKQEKVYQEMARASETQVAVIGRAWDIALAERPDMPLHDSDGHHQSAVGAFLTACVLFGHITGESPASLASFPYMEMDEKDRKFLADVAAKAIADRK